MFPLEISMSNIKALQQKRTSDLHSGFYPAMRQTKVAWEFFSFFFFWYLFNTPQLGRSWDLNQRPAMLTLQLLT